MLGTAFSSSADTPHDQDALRGWEAADVRMAEGVQNRPVYLRQEQSERLADGFVVEVANERLQQHVEVSDEHGIIGDAGDVMVEDHQVVQRFKQVFRRLQLQKKRCPPA